MNKFVAFALMFQLLAVLPACWKKLGCDKKDDMAQTK